MKKPTNIKQDTTNLEPNQIKPGKGEGSTVPQAKGSEGSEGPHHAGYMSEGGGFGGKKPLEKEEE